MHRISEEYHRRSRSRKRSRSRSRDSSKSEESRQSEGKRGNFDKNRNKRYSDRDQRDIDNVHHGRHRDRSRDRDSRPQFRRDDNSHSKRHDNDLQHKDQNSSSSKYASKSRTQREEKYIWGNIAKEEDIEKAAIIVPVPEEEKVKADFGLSGALAKDSSTGNVVNGITLKYSEPIDAAQPNMLWRLYVFKREEVIQTLYIHRKSCYLIGRDNRVVDIVTSHESCSKQHAAIQFREVDSKSGKTVKPYLIDLGTANHTFLNDQQIEDSRYYELREKDCIKFGASSREYVLLHDSSTGK